MQGINACTTHLANHIFKLRLFLLFFTANHAKIYQPQNENIDLEIYMICPLSQCPLTWDTPCLLTF